MRKQMKKEDLSRRRTKAGSTDSLTAGKGGRTSQRRQLPPRSSATNAYDLLADVCRVIREEPRRYYQGSWAVRRREDICRLLLDHGHADPAPPMCGTMACRAGWIVQLRDGCLPPADSGLDRWSSPIEDRAKELLRADYDDDSTFAGDVDSLFDPTLSTGGGLRVGTAAYAREGVKGLRAFMAKYKARLKDTTFPKATSHV